MTDDDPLLVAVAEAAWPIARQTCARYIVARRGGRNDLHEEVRLAHFGSMPAPEGSAMHVVVAEMARRLAGAWDAAHA